MKNSLKVTFVIVGTLIGAGFASGKEIEMFFFCYGRKGILGILVSNILTGIIIHKIFTIFQTQKAPSYEEFLKTISQNKTINQIVKAIIQVFLLISFYIMVAGIGSFFWQEFQIPTYFSTEVMALLCYVTFQKNIKGVISINSVLIPLLILFVLFLGIKNSSFFTQNLLTQSNCFSIPLRHNHWLISSILYASYNSIVLIPMLTQLSQYMNSNKKIKATSIICTGILTILGICIFGLLLKGKNYIATLDLPMIQIVKEFGIAYQYIYAMVMIAAIFTSAISIGYSFLTNCTKTKKAYQKVNLLLCISSIFISNIGFSNLVKNLYPVFGILGLIQILLLFRKKTTQSAKIML